MLQLRHLCGLIFLWLQAVIVPVAGGNGEVHPPPGVRGRHGDVSGEMDAVFHPGQLEYFPAFPALEFPPSHTAQRMRRRKKRDWVIPPINVAENGKGPFPSRMVQIRSSNDKEVKMLYSITGQGADQPPIGRFIIERSTGWLSVTEPLDREQQDKYTIFAQAEAQGSGLAENPMEIIINVIDMNDNKPQFTHDPFLGRVSEAAEIGFEFMKVNATDRDEPGQDSSDIRYSIRSQEPVAPGNLFSIDPITGGILVAQAGLDRESQPQYRLVVEAADGAGNGLIASSQVLITVDDSNDNAPQFTQTTYSGSVPENQRGAEVVRMEVRDEDEALSPSWRSRFRITQGDSQGLFNISTGPSGDLGIITTATELDYESGPVFTLLVVVENEAVFHGPVSVSTATVTVRVEDRNEAPVFRPPERTVSVSEDVPTGTDLVLYPASDPDLDMGQTVTYVMVGDHAGWLSLNESTGQVLVNGSLDRESAFVTDGKYTVLILAVDNAEVPATGTGTLVIEVEDVNDHAPAVDRRHLVVCSRQPQPLEIPVRDPDGPGFSQPFTAELMGGSRELWELHMDESKTGLILSVKTFLRRGEYEVFLRIHDNAGLHQDTSLQVQVCDCTGNDISCLEKVAAFGMNEALGVAGGVLALLLLLLVLLLFLRKSSHQKKDVLLQDEDSVARDTIYYYDEEGGGEEDQDFDPSQLRLDLVERPAVISVAPPLSCPPAYRTTPVDQRDIGDFIHDNLRVADGDPAAPPYDCLLVFDYEGRGSASSGATSLSSLCSCGSEEEQDYQRLAGWGPRFSRLAQLYTGGEDEEDED